MACVALSSLIGSIEIEFLQPTPRVSVSPHDQLPIISLLANLYSLQALLQKESSGEGDGDGDAVLKVRDLEVEIREFALKAEDDIELHLSNFILHQHGEKAAASHQLLLHQTLKEAAKYATDLLYSSKMCSVALTSLIKKIEQYFPKVYGFDDKAAITMAYFSQQLSTLRGCLLKERNSNNSGAAIKELETRITNFALKAEDDLQIQLKDFLQAKHTGRLKKASQKLHHTLQEAAESVQELLNIIKSRSSNDDDDDEANQTQPSNTWLKHASSTNVESDGSTSHGFLKPEGRMVGRHHDCRVIKDQLFSQNYAIPGIFSIVGMVGIGKTTVARNVYEDPSVASYFDVRGWVTVPQQYNKSGILSQLLHSITPVEEPNVIKKGSTPHEVAMQVHKCFGGKKYLIVLDNIMSKQTWEQAWTDVRDCVFNGLVGSCILLVTRHLDLKVHTHKMTLLDPKESWELFCNILSIDEEHLAPKFEKIRNRVVEKCDGLPQLIVEVAKRLSKCNNIQQGWEKIEKELESLGLLDRNALSVSYNMLPHHLKVCFLYFGVFPKRKKILVKMLIRLWIAEGFVKPLLKHKELEDEAYGYLQELTDRSILLIEDQSCISEIKTCRMHSALHSFCVGESQKEGILCAVNTQQHSGLSLKTFTNSCRWLSSYSHSFDYYVLFGTNIPRSIFFFLENPEMFVPPKLLRVLAFDTCISLQRVPVQLGGLAFLRYLSITQWFEDLDDVVSNNPNLETLVVYGNGAPTVHLPSSIWKPPNLRHLELGNSYMVDPPSANMLRSKSLAPNMMTHRIHIQNCLCKMTWAASLIVNNCWKRMPNNFLCYNLESIALEGCNSSLVASAKQLQWKKKSEGCHSSLVLLPISFKRGYMDLKIKTYGLEYEESPYPHVKEDMSDIIYSELAKCYILEKWLDRALRINFLNPSI
ncbi:PREDICTED: putative disease resistance RPP13-like protein 3 isoform X3 [Ipomoea nil]|uniref:putative disease resistance RPP13-like protein 3 isoform X3 n=1 Tax=Ipomoea nil TaxID=35883 RepID=UPI0009014E54|nr:PREDICTED: putative disease resistance RPP13-like protein 3 isoform X3 [Ipomoea nil]